MEKTRLLLADDDPLVQEGIRSILRSRDELEDVAEAYAMRAGETYLEPLIAAQVAATLAHPPGALRWASTASKRGLAALKLTAEGYWSKGKSSHTGVVTKTVNSRRSDVIKKLEIRKVAGRVRYVIREAIVAFWMKVNQAVSPPHGFGPIEPG